MDSCSTLPKQTYQLEHAPRTGAKLQPVQQAGVCAGVGGLALVLATGTWPGGWALLCLVAWAAAATAQLAWQVVRQRAQSGQPTGIGRHSRRNSMVL
jgi:hypothetical protein